MLDVFHLNLLKRLFLQFSASYKGVVRRLAEPSVVNSAVLAAAGTALACYPRFALWHERHFSIWYLEANVFVGSFVLWAFVFAWHTRYTGRPVFTWKIPPLDFAVATVAGTGMALYLHFFLDPLLRLRTPADYPASMDEWFAKMLFGLAFLQLFLTFAPFAWLIRLSQNRRVAVLLTILFAVGVVWIKHEASPNPAPLLLFGALLPLRVVLSFLSIWFYLRGGLLLAWWWGFLIETRHLLQLV